MPQGGKTKGDLMIMDKKCLLDCVVPKTKKRKKKRKKYKKVIINNYYYTNDGCSGGNNIVIDSIGNDSVEGIPNRVANAIHRWSLS